MSDLSSNPYFSGFNAEEKEEFNKITNLRKYKKDEIIFFEGEPGNMLFIIDKGRVKLVKMTKNGDEQILNIFKSGEIFAEVVIFDDDNYPATAIAVEDSSLYVVNKADFEKLLLSYPNMTLKILKVMSSRLRRAQKNIRDLGLKNSTNRMAGILTNLGDKYGVDKEGKIKISISLTQQELASMIGTSRETVSRILSKFEDEGLVTTSRKKIIINKPEELKNYM